VILQDERCRNGCSCGADSQGLDKILLGLSLYFWLWGSGRGSAAGSSLEGRKWLLVPLQLSSSSNHQFSLLTCLGTVIASSQASSAVGETAKGCTRSNVIIGKIFQFELLSNLHVVSGSAIVNKLS